MKHQLRIHHAQWTSPEIQNEVLDIVAKLVLTKITQEAATNDPKSIILDETADISKHEQVGICLRYVYDGVTKETFVRFYTTNSTDGESLYTH